MSSSTVVRQANKPRRSTVRGALRSLNCVSMRFARSVHSELVHATLITSLCTLAQRLKKAQCKPLCVWCLWGSKFLNPMMFLKYAKICIGSKKYSRDSSVCLGGNENVSKHLSFSRVLDRFATNQKYLKIFTPNSKS